MSHTVLIVDDNAVVRRLVRACIERDRNWHICGEADNGKVAVEKVKELHPDIVILDLQMPVMNGLEAARQITHFAPDTALLMFTLHTGEQLLKDARAAGIKDVISKSEDVAEHLLGSLRRACAPRPELSSRLGRDLVPSLAAGAPAETG